MVTAVVVVAVVASSPEEKRVDLMRIFQTVALFRDFPEFRLERQREAKRRGNVQQGTQDVGQPDISAMTDDPDPHQPVNASEVCSARTRLAMPGASRASDASCLARDAE